MKSKRTVSVAGECYALPFMVKNNWVVDANNQNVAEVGTASSARWLAQVLNEHFHKQIEELQLLQVISVANWFDNFEVNYDPVDKKTIIRGWARYCTNNFFWNSGDTIKEFYQGLERFFMEEGNAR